MLLQGMIIIFMSYPMVFERRMKSAFEALQIKLIVHNIAQDRTTVTHIIFVMNRWGTQSRLVGWEQSYNCGRDQGVFELVARIAAWSKAVVYYSASGGFIPDTCAPSSDPIPWISEKWTPDLGKTLFLRLSL